MNQTPPSAPVPDRAPRRARATAILALMLAGLALAIPASAATSTQVWVTGGTDCSHERYKPKQIVIACADGTEVLKSLRWSRWTGRQASASGRDYLVSCTPDCAAGHRTAYPVTVTLTKPLSCKGQLHQVFSRAVVRFPKTHPASRRTETDRLGCPS
jgi:Tfp pilus assembly protein PilV